MWLAGAKVVDLHGWRGNGPFGATGHRFYGVILHVNVDEHGTSDAFFKSNPGDVTPNFQVYKDGSVHQYLPFDWQPWCQIAGNFNYAAIETAGMPDEALTVQQCTSIAKILKTYHDEMGMVLQIANRPGERGLGTHQMGGIAWGGHSCPGSVRASQRSHLLELARGNKPTPHPVTPPAHKPTLHRRWPTYMGKSDYFGLMTGPAHSHGGYFMQERPDVKAIQLRLQQLGYAPKTAGWADGRFEYPTFAAVQRWQQHYMPHTQFYGQVWSDDWIRLFTY